MAVNTPGNIRFASSGTVFLAPVGTVAPYDVTVAPSVTWVELGYLDTNGIEATPAITTQAIEAWQSAVPIKYLTIGASFQAKFVLQQFDKEAVQLYFGASFALSKDAAAANIVGQYTLDISSAPVVAEQAILIRWNDATIKNQLLLPRTSVTARDGLKLVRTSNQQLGVTLDALDSGGSLGALRTNANMS